MKKILSVFTILMLSVVVFTPKTNSQAYQDQKITVRQSDLTPDQIAKIKLQEANDELQKKLDTYGKWVGVGGEIGTAVKEGLSSVVDVADKFGSTNVGKFTMTMIAWKVIGKDIVRIFLGLIFFITYTCVLIYSYRRTCTTRSVLTSNPGFMKYPKTYEVVEAPFEDEGLAWMVVLHIVLFLISIWITCAIMF